MSESRAENAAALEGALLDGRFFIQRLLGKGNFGAVYLAEQRAFSIPLRTIALKLFKQEMVNEDNAAKLLNDAVMLLRLQQEPDYEAVAPWMVNVYDAGFMHEPAGQAYLLTEYIEGYTTPSGSTINSLDRLIVAHRPVPVPLALEWMIQIATPLAWMHTLSPPVLHCDLKPDNILVAGKDRLKLADFGLAQLTVGNMGILGPAGAISYQSPETLMNRLPTPASDVYAMGLMLYEMLTGTNPLNKVGLDAHAEGRTDDHINEQIASRQAGLPPLADCEHPDLKCHPLVVEIAEKCLSFDTPNRYPNAALLLEDLKRCAGGQGIRVVRRVAAAPQAAPPSGASPDRLLSEAQVLVQQGRLEEAEGRAQSARRAHSRAPGPYVCLSVVRIEQGRWQQGVQICAEGLKLMPGSPELLQACADCYEAGGRTAVADALRKEAVRRASRASRE